MTPQLCTGTVMHARFAARQSPTAHRFVYPLFFLALPLSRKSGSEKLAPEPP